MNGKTQFNNAYTRICNSLNFKLLILATLSSFSINQAISQQIISGRVFLDVDLDSSYSSSDRGQMAIRVYLYHDIDEDGVVDPTDELEDSVTTDAGGNFSFKTGPGGYLIRRSIEEDANDASEVRGTGAMSLSNNSVSIGGGNGATGNISGFRFTNIPLQSTDSIYYAFLRFKNDYSTGGDGTITIRIEDNVSAPEFTSTASDISSRTLVSDSVVFDPENWGSLQHHQSPDISDLIKSVTGKTGWRPGQDMAFVVTGTATRSQADYTGSVDHTVELVMYTNSGTIITSQPQAQSDDVEERKSNGSIDLNDGSLDFVEGPNSQYIGIRFPNVEINAADSILYAYIRFRSYDTESAASSATIYGESNANASTFSNTSYDVTSRSSTSATVSWSSIQSWTVDNYYSTPDISSIVKEIKGLGSWASGNAMTIILDPSGDRRFSSYDDDPDYGPELVIVKYDSNYTTRQYVMALNENDLDPEFFYTNLSTNTATANSTMTNDTGNLFGFVGEMAGCMVVSDREDALHMVNRYSGIAYGVGPLKTGGVEAIAFGSHPDTLYGVSDDTFGIINQHTGLFTPLSGFPLFGGTGALGAQTFDDIDGLTFDYLTGTMYASIRRSASADLLTKIDRYSGFPIIDAFGSGVDYVVLSGTGMNDLDDLAANALDGKLYAVNNNSGSTTQLITIDKTTGAGTIIDTMNVDDFEGQGYYNSGDFYGTTGSEAGAGDSNAFFIIDKSTAQVTRKTFFRFESDFEACDCLTGQPMNVILGTVFEDSNEDTTYNNGVEAGAANADVYLYKDMNRNRTIDAGDSLFETKVSNANGNYIFLVSDTGYFRALMDSNDVAGYMTTDVNEVADFESLGLIDPNNNFGFSNTLLNIEFIHIDAQRVQDNEVKVDWKINTPKRADYFIIERYNAEMILEEIGHVKNRTLFENSFSFYDYSPLEGVSYYRIKGFSNSGKVIHSELVELKPLENSAGLIVYPTLATDYIHLKNESEIEMGKTTYTISTVDGKIMYQGIFIKLDPKQSFTIPIEFLSAGNYFIQIDSANKSRLEFTKQ